MKLHWIIALVSLVVWQEALALILVGGTEPKHNPRWPVGAEELANLPTRRSCWEGPPFGGGDYHFNYAANKVVDFQAALDAFAAIRAQRLELVVYDGVTTSPSPLAEGKVDWEFEVWDPENFDRIKKVEMGINPWSGQPLPAPVMTLYLGPSNIVNWSTVRVPANVTLLDHRVATSPYSASTGGVVRATIRDMANGKPLPKAILEVGHYAGRDFQPDCSVVTGRDGIAIVRDLPPGDYILRSRRDGYAMRQFGSFKNFGRTFEVFNDVKLSPSASLQGHVIDQDGKPLEAVTVGLIGLAGSDGSGYEQNLYNEKTKCRTDAEGKFTLNALPTGRARLLVAKPGYFYYPFEACSVPGPVAKIVMSATGVVRGRVTGLANLPTNQTLQVSLQPLGQLKDHWRGETRCAVDGGYVFEGVPPGRYLLNVNLMENNFLTRPSPTLYTANGGTVSVSTQPAQEITLRPGDQLEVNTKLNP